MFIRILQLDTGGQKYLGFAKSKIRMLKDSADRRRDSAPLVSLPEGCDFAHKVYKFSDATVYIHIQGEFASIRIVAPQKPQSIYYSAGLSPGFNGFTTATVLLPNLTVFLGPPSFSQFGTYIKSGTLKDGIISTGPLFGTFTLTLTEKQRVVKALRAASLDRLAADFISAFSTGYTINRQRDDFRISGTGDVDSLIQDKLVPSAANPFQLALNAITALQAPGEFQSGSAGIEGIYEGFIFGALTSAGRTRRSYQITVDIDGHVSVGSPSFTHIDLVQSFTLNQPFITKPQVTLIDGAHNADVRALNTTPIVVVDSAGSSPGHYLSGGGIQIDNPQIFTGNSQFPVQYFAARSLEDELYLAYSGVFSDATGPLANYGSLPYGGFVNSIGERTIYGAAVTEVADPSGVAGLSIHNQNANVRQPDYFTLLPAYTQTSNSDEGFACLYDTTTRKKTIVKMLTGFRQIQSNYIFKKFFNRDNDPAHPTADQLLAALAAHATVIYDTIGISNGALALLVPGQTAFAV